LDFIIGKNGVKLKHISYLIYNSIIKLLDITPYPDSQ